MTPRWAGEDVQVRSTTLARLADGLPIFSRVPLSLSLDQPADHQSTFGWLFGHRTSRAHPHRYLDAIVRQTDQGAAQVPIALVSKRYTLVQHRTLVEALRDAIAPHFANAADFTCQMTMSEYGGRMKVRVLLPDALKPPDGEDIRPTLECFNSVDGSRPLQVYLGWFRFVCENGLVIGEELVRLRRRHVKSLQLPDVGQAVADSLGHVSRQADALDRWWHTHVSAQQLREWTDVPVAQRWGSQAAARVFHIARTGRDCRVRLSRGIPASALRTEATTAVPGSTPPNDNAYRISQALTYVARARQEIDAVHDRLADVRLLMQHIAPMYVTQQRV